MASDPGTGQTQPPLQQRGRARPQIQRFIPLNLGLVFHIVDRARSGQGLARAHLDVGGVFIDGFRNDAVGFLGEVLLQSTVQLGKLRPQGFLDESGRYPGHDGGASLPGITVGPDIVATQKRHKQPVRPRIAEGESEFDRRIDFGKRGQALSNPFPRFARGYLLSGRSRPVCEQGLDPPQFLDQSMVFDVVHSRVFVATRRNRSSARRFIRRKSRASQVCHHNEDEYSFVLRGRLGALLGDDLIVAEAERMRLSGTFQGRRQPWK